MTFLPLDTLRSGAAELGITLSDHQLAQFDLFAQLIVETNSKYNLTRILEPADIVTSHYLDSLTCLVALQPRENARVIDVGTGAGFPGIPLKIVRPDLKVTLLEATRKKVDFLSQAISALELEGITAVNGRAEEVSQNKSFRERFDIAYARALSEMKVLAELCLPLVKVGGHLIAQKSTNVDEEMSAARAIMGQLGGRLVATHTIKIPGTDIARQLLVISKNNPTPPQYPRTYARIVGKTRKS